MNIESSHDKSRKQASERVVNDKCDESQGLHRVLASIPAACTMQKTTGIHPRTSIHVYSVTNCICTHSRTYLCQQRQDILARVLRMGDDDAELADACLSLCRVAAGGAGGRAVVVVSVFHLLVSRVASQNPRCHSAEAKAPQSSASNNSR